MSEAVLKGLFIATGGRCNGRKRCGTRRGSLRFQYRENSKSPNGLSRDNDMAQTLPVRPMPVYHAYQPRRGRILLSPTPSIPRLKRHPHKLETLPFDILYFLITSFVDLPTVISLSSVSSPLCHGPKILVLKLVFSCYRPPRACMLFWRTSRAYGYRSTSTS